MAEDTIGVQENDEASDAAVDSDVQDEVAGEEAGANEQDVQTPEFNELKGDSVDGGSTDLNRLNDVQVVVSAELGRTKVPIENLLKLTVGSVFELDRSIDSPVELIAQGVPIGNGEVVVVDGNFAIRIQEIYANQ